MLLHKIKNRKGEILTSKLVGTLLIVAAFVILLFVVYTLWSGGVADTQKEECSFSIRNRATAKLIAATEVLPLKCKTQKICLSLSGEDCEELSSTKDNPVRKVRLKPCATERRNIIPGLDPPAIDPIKGENGVCPETNKQIMEVFADTMIRCHSMVGEGNLNFLPKSADWNKQKYGLICARIVFDREAKERLGTISYGEFYRSLESRPVGEKSALNYLYPGVRGGAEYFFQIYQQSKENLDNEKSLKGVTGKRFIPSRIKSYKGWGINPEQKFGYAIIASIVEESYGKQLWGGAGVTAVVGVGLLATGIGSPLGVALLAGSAGSAVFYYSGGFDDKYKYSPPAIYPFELDQLKRLGISSFEIAP
jgi:hypothetical protein